MGWVGGGAWLISQSLRGRRVTTGGLPLFGRRLAPVFSCRRWREMHAGALLLFALSNRSAWSSVRVLFWSSGLIVEPGGEHRVSNFFHDNHTRRSEKNKLESLGTDQLHFLSLSRRQTQLNLHNKIHNAGQKLNANLSFLYTKPLRWRGRHFSIFSSTDYFFDRMQSALSPDRRWVPQQFSNIMSNNKPSNFVLDLNISCRTV